MTLPSLSAKVSILSKIRNMVSSLLASTLTIDSLVITSSSLGIVRLKISQPNSSLKTLLFQLKKF